MQDTENGGKKYVLMNEVDTVRLTPCQDDGAVWLELAVLHEGQHTRVKVDRISAREIAAHLLTWVEETQR